MTNILKQLTEIFASLVSPITAVMVGYIAYRQWKSDEQEKQRRKMEKKILIFKAVSEHLSHIDRTLKVDEETYKSFRLAYTEAQFYFPNDTVQYLSEININSHQWLLEYAYLQENGESESDDLHENLNVLITASVELENKLGIYVIEKNI
jgi:hypothetical protein